MGRDHSIQCDRCGAWYGGFDGPDECPCMATLVNDGNRVAVLREVGHQADRSSQPP